MVIFHEVKVRVSEIGKIHGITDLYLIQIHAAEDERIYFIHD